MKLTKFKAELYTIVLLFLFMLLLTFYMILGNELKPIFRRLLYCSINHSLVIGLLFSVYLLSKTNALKILIKYSAIPYFVLKLVYECFLYLGFINQYINCLFLTVFIALFFYGLKKISIIKRDPEIEN